MALLSHKAGSKLIGSLILVVVLSPVAFIVLAFIFTFFEDKCIGLHRTYSVVPRQCQEKYFERMKYMNEHNENDPYFHPWKAAMWVTLIGSAGYIGYSVMKRRD